MDWVRRSTAPCLIEAATGAGKSHLVANIAHEIHRISGKRVLCLAPSAELVTQNREKYLATGNPASIFSASAGSVCMRHPVVFGTPGTVKNKAHRFGEQFAMIVIDEAHGITPTVQKIVDAIRDENPNVRVLGLTATPYRLGSGYIYALQPNGNPVPEHQAREPYFTQLVERITAHELIEQGYLTPPVIGSINSDGYQTSDMALNGRGQFDKSDIDRAYHGHGRKTSAIVADVVAQSRNREGVMLFAATVQHAEEVMASLPPGLSAIVTGKTKSGERKRIIERFKAREIKYLVNVSVLTTGFDAAHVDVIALLRATESVGLLQQIIGRGLRLDDGKKDCLVLDYAENLDRHCPDGDVFNPQISAMPERKGGGTIEAQCPDCGAVNEFGARDNPDRFDVDKQGYFIDLAGERIQTDHGFMPAHHGRRCLNHIIMPGRPEGVRCSYRWTGKECPHCGADNDIAARYCSDCRGEIIDPNEKLRIEFKALKKDPTRMQCDRVVNVEEFPTVSRSGNDCLKVTITTEYRTFTIWLQKHAKWPKARHDMDMYRAHRGQIETVTYQKDGDSGFYRVLSYNQEPDNAPQ